MNTLICTSFTRAFQVLRQDPNLGEILWGKDFPDSFCGTELSFLLARFCGICDHYLQLNEYLFSKDAVCYAADLNYRFIRVLISLWVDSHKGHFNSIDSLLLAKNHETDKIFWNRNQVLQLYTCRFALLSVHTLAWKNGKHTGSFCGSRSEKFDDSLNPRVSCLKNQHRPPPQKKQNQKLQTTSENPTFCRQLFYPNCTKQTAFDHTPAGAGKAAPTETEITPLISIFNCCSLNKITESLLITP